MRRETPQWTNRPFLYLKSVRANAPAGIFAYSRVATPTSTNCFKKAYVRICTPTVALASPCIKTTNKCAFVCVWTPCVSKVLCMFCTRDMNSCFVLSACVESDFPHFTGHPAVWLHCTCAPQFVSKRFPKSQNIFSAIQCAPHMQKGWSAKLGCAQSPVAWPTAAILYQWF